MNKFCSIRTLDGVYTKFWIDPLLDVADDADALTALGVMIAIDCIDADTNHAQSATIAQSNS